jgi:hypothetical protein
MSNRNRTNEDMFDIDDQTALYNNKMSGEMHNQMRDWNFEMKRIKGEDTSKFYKETRAKIIDTAVIVNYEKHKDKNHESIPDFLYTVPQPWSSGFGPANLAYDEDQVYRLTSLCQMEINSKHGHAGQGSF